MTSLMSRTRFGIVGISRRLAGNDVTSHESLLGYRLLEVFPATI
jgi:hypothetical protein